ncbi:hypothetical protein D1AOALGA4SA_7556 [Olavius algarvensis Delta 1 endosymbiont]|nr:hypothetical protein D1AOALGA4SA_7556 [Olavius algarvensis Delta 1 endosymbiont]
MIAMPVLELHYSLLSRALGRQIRRSKKGGIFSPITSKAC